ncbi:MAG: PQQ-binding-like beta-propeller repeat protein [Chitinophagaceae bacterium]|nr:PQQ-binding-like beta-propeller repeat protein [Chitinophagaceae bacterium]
MKTSQVFLFLIFFACFSCKNNSERFKNWASYRGDDGITAYSPLTQINPENVHQLQVAWTFRTHDTVGRSSIQCNPLIIDGILYGVSPRQKTFALEAATGKLLWKFDPYEGNDTYSGVTRGLAYYEDGGHDRIFVSASYKLFALDAQTGKQILNFGDSGFVDLRKGLRDDTQVEKYSIENTSPGIIYKDMIIVGSSMGETYTDMPGNIRAFDVKTGKLRWIFNTIPKPGEPGYESWPQENYKSAAGCNVWSGFSIDRKRGMLFAATGSPGFDFHGGNRKGDNLYANCVLALDAETGKYKWHFQVSHHDVWDYDLPTPPILVTIRKDGKPLDAVVQLSKQGWIMVFERETGKPVFPIEEREVPQSRMKDEHSSPTQPFPLKPAPLARHHFDTSLVTDISKESHDYVIKEISNYSFGGIYLPQDTQGIVQVPGFRGGGEWSGGAFDPETNIIYIGANDIPNVVKLVEVKNEDEDEFFKMPVLKAGEKVYQNNCAACHGADRKGIEPVPSLVDVSGRLKPSEALEIVEKGRSKMPSFISLPLAQREAAIAYLFNLKNQKLTRAGNKVDDEPSTQPAKRYRIKGYTQLKDQFGYPGIKPPWGTLNAVDLATGEYVWKRTLGEYPELKAKGVPETGTQLFGGGIVTAGGLIFIAASRDEKFRAIDKKTGKTLWEFQLPVGGYATPATYEVDGQQYIVIAAGGGGLQATRRGDYYFAFSLPPKK